jgi:regulator of nucleoside diphosphate kinase
VIFYFSREFLFSSLSGGERVNPTQILLTRVDAEKLIKLIGDAQREGYRGSSYIKLLAGEIDKAQIVDPHEIPSDVITLNSTAQLVDLETNEEMVYTLVFPENANPLQGKISILAPIGTAMLGYRAGDTFEWETPGGKRVLHIKAVTFQPEASGDFS